MQIRGQLKRITDPRLFATDYVLTSGAPEKGFRDWGAARVNLAVDLGTGFTSSFFPATSIKVDTDARGGFALNVPDSLEGRPAYLIAYTLIRTVALPPPAPAAKIYGPIYRSQVFRIPKTGDLERVLFVFPATLPDQEGIKQEDLDRLVAKFKEGLDSARVRITASDVNGRGSLDDGTVAFDIKVRPATSSDLGELVAVKAENIDLDLPGPDWITGLCVDEAAVEKRLRSGVREVGTLLNARIREQMLKQLPGGAAFVDQATVSVRDVRFPVIGTRNVTIPGFPFPLPVDVHAVAVDPCIGVPRSLV